MRKKYFQKIINTRFIKFFSLGIVLVVIFLGTSPLFSQMVMGISMTVSQDGEDLVINAYFNPTYLDTTVTLVPDGVAFASISSPKIVYVDASTSMDFLTNNTVTHSYTIPAENIVVTSSGDIMQILSFPSGDLSFGTNYYFRARVGTFYGSVVSFGTTTPPYGSIDQSSNPNFQVLCGGDFGDTVLSSNYATLPCLVIGNISGSNPNIAVAYGVGEVVNWTLSPNILNILLNQDQEFSFNFTLPGLTPSTTYSFKIVDNVSPSIGYTGLQQFTTTSGATTNNTNANVSIPGNGSQYGAGDDTDFSSEEYKQSLVKCNGTPTDPCRFSNLSDLINRIVKFLLVMILPLSAIIFAYAGFLYLTSAGNTEAHGKVKNLLTKAVWGVIIILSAWLLVRTIFWAVGIKPDVNLLDSTDQSQDQILNL